MPRMIPQQLPFEFSNSPRIGQESPALLAELEDFKEVIAAMLTAREWQLIRLRYFSDGPRITRERLGLRFRLSAERIRQIENGALLKIRQLLVDDM